LDIFSKSYKISQNFVCIRSLWQKNGLSSVCIFCGFFSQTHPVTLFSNGQKSLDKGKDKSEQTNLWKKLRQKKRVAFAAESGGLEVGGSVCSDNSRPDRGPTTTRQHTSLTRARTHSLSRLLLITWEGEEEGSHL
jgi:hypothetical protein